MSTDSEPSSPPPQQTRRKSFVELLTGRSPTDNGVQGTTSSNTPKTAGTSMASAMAQSTQQGNTRRLSITTLGLSGSPPQPPTSPFGSLRRGYSTSERSSAMEENESAVEENDGVPQPSGSSEISPGSSPFRRRVSFGGLAYKDSRSGSNGQVETAGSAGGLKAGSPPNKGRDGFDWSENLRKRAERTSISAGSGGTFLPLTAHGRSKSTATSSAAPPPSAAPAPVAAPKPAAKAPDHFQERILKGDFYMD